MPKSLFRVAVATAITALSTLAVTGHVSAHSNSIVCIDQATSTYRITNDYPLAESFTSPQGPSGNVAAGNGSYTDVVYVGDSLQIDAVWSDGFTESRTGTGDCTPEGGTTTTEATTSTSPTTTDVTTTVPSTIPTTTEGPTTVPTVTTVPTSTQPSPTTTPTTSSEPSTSSSVATSSTTSTLPTTSPSTSSSTLPAPSSTTPAPTPLPPECSDNPNTPTDDCAPICPPVTLEDGTNSCGPSLPATGTDILWLLPAAIFMTLCGAVIVYSNRRQ